jgi:hypothetical protein
MPVRTSLRDGSEPAKQSRNQLVFFVFERVAIPAVAISLHYLEHLTSLSLDERHKLWKITL